MSALFSSRQFNQDTSGAKKAARFGPVIVTDRGRPSHVLMTIEDYNGLTGRQRNIARLLGAPETADMEFDPPTLDIHPKIAEFD